MNFLFYDSVVLEMRSVSILAVLALAFGCSWALDATLNQSWKLWKDSKNKQYTAAEEQLR